MVEKNKIWIVTEYYYPVNTSTGYYVTEIAESLAIKYNNVHVLCTNAKYYKSDKAVLSKTEIHNKVHIHRVLTGDINKNKFILRTLRLLLSSLKLFFKVLLSVKKNDQILVVTNPAFLILLMPLIKSLKEIQYTILVHDIFPENLIALGKLNKNSIVSKVLKKWFDFAYSKANKNIVIGRDMEEVIAYKTCNSTQIELIPNWADVDDIKPLNKDNTSLIQKLDLKDKFVYQFAGNLGHAQGLMNILNGIKLVENRNIHFLFIGSGALEETINASANSYPLQNLTIVGFQKRSDQGDFLNACDVAIVTLSDGMYGLGVPSKSYNIMAAGKPILIVADENSEISLCVKENNIGWVIEPNKPEVLANYFEKIYDEFLNNSHNLADPRIIAETLFSKKDILEKYNQLFAY